MFTPNFDEVLERAYAFVSGESLTPFHLEGSYAALDALNAERYPLYAKVHGDFRYRSIRNLSADLQRNDAEIQKCFLAASNRYGMIVAGYSGRDFNVMQMFNSAMEQANAFPHGIYWTTPHVADAPKPVLDLIASARSKGVSAFIVETGTFDTMMTKIWRQLPEKSVTLDQKSLHRESGLRCHSAAFARSRFSAHSDQRASSDEVSDPVRQGSHRDALDV